MSQTTTMFWICWTRWCASRYSSPTAAIIAGYALSAPSAASVHEITTAITQLRDVLGDQVYESLARKGGTMTTAEMVTYAYHQIDQTRTELNGVS
jgi:hypothetical protein